MKLMMKMFCSMNTNIVNRKYIQGKKYGQLVVLEYSHKGAQNRAYWRCLCTCGNKIIVSGSKLRNGHTKSCGCSRSASLSGNNHPNWKGGLTPVNKRLRNTKKYKIWRTSVFIRDEYTCRICKKRGGLLNADHIKPFSKFPDLRFLVENGRTLCVQCHRKTETYGGRK